MENTHANTSNNTNVSSLQKSIAIVYKSKYGATKDYAKWLKKALITRQIPCDIYEADKASMHDLEGYGAVVFAGGIYGGELSIAKALKDFAKYLAKRLVNHTTSKQKEATTQGTQSTPKIYCILIGLSSSQSPRQSTLDKNFTLNEQEGIEFHFLQGRLDFGKLDNADRERMNAYREMLRAKASKTEEQKALLENEAVDFTRRDSLKCVIDSLVGENFLA